MDNNELKNIIKAAVIEAIASSETIFGIVARMDSLEADIKATNKEIETIKNKIEEVNDIIRNLDTAVYELEADVERFPDYDTIVTTGMRLADFDNLGPDIGEEIFNNVQKVMHDITSDIDAIDKRVDEMNDKLEQLPDAKDLGNEVDIYLIDHLYDYVRDCVRDNLSVSVDFDI
jgi:peptidoglycan hydrolase CwlO-like protein